jgi:hypothetical protein
MTAAHSLLNIASAIRLLAHAIAACGHEPDDVIADEGGQSMARWGYDYDECELILVCEHNTPDILRWASLSPGDAINGNGDIAAWTQVAREHFRTKGAKS